MKHVMIFQGSVTTGASVTLVSQRLRFPYVLENLRVKFALGHVGLVQHRFFVSDDELAPTTEQPSGSNILKQYGNVDYVIGDDDVLELKDETHVTRQGTYIKVFVTNSDTVTHTINVVATIEDMRVHPSAVKILELLNQSTERLTKHFNIPDKPVVTEKVE